MDNVESDKTSRFLTQETGSISIISTLKGSDSTLFSCWRVPISRNPVSLSSFSKRRSLTPGANLSVSYVLNYIFSLLE